jgi:CRP-like cAMP-binding protein
MSFESVINYLSSIITLSEAFMTALEGSLTGESYQPRQVIHAAGQIENRLWFVDSGFARTYYFDQAGREHTIAFYSDQDFIFSHQGYWKEPAAYYLEALYPTILISLSYDALATQVSQFEEAGELVSIFLRHHYQREQFRNRLLTWAAEERYRQTRKLNPELFRKVSVRLIATYLNMTRENLSRLMGKDL